MNQEQEPKSQPLPIVSNETAKILSEDFGLDISASTERVIQGITAEKQLSYREIFESQAVNIFTDLASANPQFVETIHKHLSNAKDSALKTNSGANAAVVGMALVLRAYDIETNYDLISRFRNLQSSDIKTIDQLLERFLASSPRNILEQVLRGPKIPDQQINLNEILTKVTKIYLGFVSNSYYKRYVHTGATTMYEALGTLWPKLFPQGESQTQSPS